MIDQLWLNEKYKVIMTILNGNGADYEKCVLEIRKESIGIETCLLQ